MSASNEVILKIDKCSPSRIAPNRVMLCVRNIFLLENMRDIFQDEYEAIIKGSGNAGIIKN